MGLLAPLIPAPKRGGRPRTVDMREVLNAIFMWSKPDANGACCPVTFHPKGRCIKGRKRHLLVDTLGLVLNVVITEANMNDRRSMSWLLRSVQPALPRLRLVWADGGYQSEALALALYKQSGIRLEIVKPPLARSGFRLQAKRWIVERTFAWLGNARRLSKDYELYFKSSASMIYAAMTRIMLRRLAHLASPS